MRRTRLAPLALLAAVAAAGPIAADDVYLTNGNSFAGVIARVEGDQVRIRLPYGGEIGLPLARVERIERAESAFERYLARKQALRARPDAAAADWVELALWARAEGFDHGCRDAALTAARLDPQAPEVAPLLRSLDHVFDDRLAEWVPRDEAMRRNGLVRFRGGWVAAEERDRLVREDEERERRRAERAREERLDRLAATVEAVVELELARTLARPQAPVYVPIYTPTVVWPGVFFVAPAPPPAPPGPAPPMAAPPEPVPASHRGSFESPFGGTLGPPELIPGRLNPDAAPPPGRLGSTRR
jgi:hypothetical protein